MADKIGQPGLFGRLTSLFRSGPTVRRRIKTTGGQPDKGLSSGQMLFRRSNSDTYNATLSSYGSFDRMSRYSDFGEMESTPEISSALDIYAEESVSPDVSGRILHIYSENRKIQELLETLFFDTLNLDFNLPMWVRNLCKYGDFFLFNDVSSEYGIINVYPIPISEIEREEGYDAMDPSAVRFRWLTQGNKLLENWQVSHFRLLGNDAFLPYGSSVLESARRIWRQLILIEDAMLVYRVIRSPERRVFYVDVGNVPPEEISNYVEQAKTALKRNQIVDTATGRVDIRYNPMSVDEDYFIPVRGGESGTRVESLSGGTNTSAIEDVEYIQKKLFAALKIPKAYLGYDEDIGAKATLAQEDIRFSRTIHRVQKTIVAELNKIAMIHLYSHGYQNEDLLDFDLKLANPSSIAQQQKLELIRSKFEIAGAAPEGLVDRNWIRKNVLELTDEVIESIEKGKVQDKKTDLELEAVQADTGGDDAGGGDEGGGDDAGGDEGGGEEDLFASDDPGENVLDGLPISALKKDPDDDEEDDDDDDDDHSLLSKLSIDDEEAPIKASSAIKNAFGGDLNKPKRYTTASTHMPDFAKMVSVKKGKARPQDTMLKPYTADDVLEGPFDRWEERIEKSERGAVMTPDMKQALKQMNQSLHISSKSILTEREGSLSIVDALLNDDDPLDNENE